LQKTFKTLQMQWSKSFWRKSDQAQSGCWN